MRRFALLLVPLLLASAACGGQTAASATITVGAIYPVSGSQAAGGRDEWNGVQAALAVAKRSGALGDRNLVLKLVPVETPQGAADAVDRLVDQDHVSVVIGTYGSTLSEAAAARADQRRVVYWETGAVADGITLKKHYVFRTVATGSTLGRTAVEFVSKVLMPAAKLQPGQAKAVILHVNDVYGESVATGEQQRAAQLGIQVVESVAYDPAAFNATTLAQRLAADKPDYLFDVSYLDDGIAVWRAILDQGVKLRAAVGTSSAWCMPAFGQALGNQAIGVYAADKPDDGVSPGVLDPEGRSLLAQARAAYAALSGKPSMPISAVAGFVGGWTLFHDVIPGVSGELTADQVRAAAYRVDVPYGREINGGGVQFSLSDTYNGGQNRRAAAVVGQWQAAGVMKVVYPSGYASADPLMN